VPIALIGFRFTLAIVCLLLAVLRRFFTAPGWVFVLILIAAVLSDIFDGVIARRTGVASARLRRLDSQTDLVFWSSAGIAAMLLHPAIVRAQGWEFAALIGLELCCYGVSFARFGKETCTHAYSAKAYGLALLLGLTSVLGFDRGGWPIDVMFTAGLIAGLDVILIVLLLPCWAHDVPTFYHAWTIRTADDSRASARQAGASRSRLPARPAKL
jgi:CDP-diacylglycerol--glycerol-3-phosphate 3-phosphatidyltransferase